MSDAGNPYQLPDHLPVPVDDGACNHLIGMKFPSISLPSTAGKEVDLASLKGRLVVYCYPRTGKPGQALPRGWDEIPGARGCTPQTCAFRDYYRKLVSLGMSVFGLSTQDSAYQQEAAQRLHLPFALLSDERLAFVRALRLPTFEVEGMTLIKRLTLIVRDAEIEKVFYPVFPPDRNAQQIVDWLSRKPSS